MANVDWSQLYFPKYVTLNNERVENANFTSLRKGTYSKSWKAFWEEQTNCSWPEKCVVYDCFNQALYGGHVRVLLDHRMFIIPLCASCNSWQKRAWFYVEDGTRAAIVREEDTTGPQQVCYSDPVWW